MNGATALRGASSSRAPGVLPGDCGIESAPRSTVSRACVSQCLQAFAVGLRPEAAAFAAGRNDGAKGADFRPLDDWSPARLRAAVAAGDQVTMAIILNYALGFQAAGRSISKETNKGGTNARVL